MFIDHTLRGLYFVLDVSSSALSHCDFFTYPAIVKVIIFISPLCLFLCPSLPLQSVLDIRKVGAAEGGTEVETAGEHPTVATRRDTDLKGNITTSSYCHVLPL